MNPCNCKDMQDVTKLKEQGLNFNDWSITVKPLSVIVNNNQFRIKIPQHYFKRFAE